MNIFTRQYKTVDPVITVMIPMFRAEYIGWVALESLANQNSVSFPWELIIAEEQQDETFGWLQLLTYESKLVANQCVKISYVALKTWIPLADKMSLMVQYSHSRTNIFIFHAADYYSNPKRLNETYYAFTDENVCWFIPPKLLEFNIQRQSHILCVDKTKTKRQDDMPGKAIRARIVRQALNYMLGRSRSVDGLVYLACKEIFGDSNIFTINKSDSWQQNLSVEGIGTLSNKVTDRLFRRPNKWDGAYSVWPHPLETIVPESIARRLSRSKINIRYHNLEIPECIK